MPGLFGTILGYLPGGSEERKVQEGQATVKPVELQADFFAGFLAGVRKPERPSFPAPVFAVTPDGMGDDMIHEPQHHGTPDKRAAAIIRGLEVAYRERRRLSEATDLSIARAKSV